MKETNHSSTKSKDIMSIYISPTQTEEARPSAAAAPTLNGEAIAHIALCVLLQAFLLIGWTRLDHFIATQNWLTITILFSLNALVLVSLAHKVKQTLNF